jgi:hypothetical protein
MTTNLSKAQELLFGEQGLGVSNFKLFPGSDRDATVEAFAGQIAASAEKLINGQLEEGSLY